LLAAGADVITLGNHTYRRDGIGPYLERSERVIRPANQGAWTQGRGLAVVDGRVAVLSLMGQLFIDVPVSPWEIVDALVEEARAQAPVVVVDFHAEATSEKIAMATWLDGRVTAVIGTHTHVQTNDAALLRGGTAYLTDAGMTGPHDSVIGVRAEIVLRRFLTQLPQKFETAEGDVRLEGALIECDAATGRATAVETFRRKL
jgi:2',3'-cyclic-nucleotide 2'-phosphodiesterase